MADPTGSSPTSPTSGPTSPTTPPSSPTTPTPPPSSSTTTPPPSSTTTPPSSTSTPPPTTTTGSPTGTGSSSGTPTGTPPGTASSTGTATTPTGTGTLPTQSTSTVTIFAPPSVAPGTSTQPATVPTNQADSSGTGSGSSSFFDNKAAVAGVFTIVGLAGLVLLVALLTNFIRRRRAAQFDRDVIAASAAPPTFYDDDMREPRAPRLYPAEEDMYDMQHYSSTPSPPRGGAYWNPNAPVPPSQQQWNAAPIAAQNPFASPPGSPPHPYAPYPPYSASSSPSPPQRAPSLQGGNARGAYAAMALAAEERSRQARSPPPGQYPAALLSALDPAPPRGQSTSPQHGGAADGSTSTTDEALPNPFRSRTSHDSEADRKSIGDADDYWQPGRGPLKVANE